VSTEQQAAAQLGAVQLCGLKLRQLHRVHLQFGSVGVPQLDMPNPFFKKTIFHSDHRQIEKTYIFFVYFFGGLECVGYSFAYVAHL
jgi:hypothetical protein